MKNILVIAVVALSFTACKKDRTCTCNYTTDAPSVSGVTYTQTDEMTITKVSKKNAKAICADETSVSTAPGTQYTTTRDCTLK